VKIRYRITLWVALAGFLTSLVFSLVVFLEMIEQPYELLDSELETAAAAVADRLAKDQLKEPVPVTAPFLPGDRYWIKVYNQKRGLMYQSDLSLVVDLPLHNKGDDGYTVRTHIPPNIPKDRAYFDQDMGGKVAFRVRVIHSGSNDNSYVIQIARTMEELDDEISEVSIILGIGLVASTVLLVVISYFFAGRIVSPIGEINRLSREINENTLEKRIPLGKSRDELYELSSALNGMFDRLQHSFKKQKEFLASASHELKRRQCCGFFLTRPRNGTICPIPCINNW
jgi:two-component system OmpR family sensor kinase